MVVAQIIVVAMLAMPALIAIKETCGTHLYFQPQVTIIHIFFIALMV